MESALGGKEPVRFQVVIGKNRPSFMWQKQDEAARTRHGAAGSRHHAHPVMTDRVVTVVDGRAHRCQD